jgi:hypothetical protein
MLSRTALRHRNQPQPERVSRGSSLSAGVISGGHFRLVALEQFCSNTVTQRAHDETTVRSAPVCRRRVTNSLRADVIEHYTQGMTTRQVASTVRLGRTTVLKVLKDAGVAVRSQGRKYDCLRESNLRDRGDRPITQQSNSPDNRLSHRQRSKIKFTMMVTNHIEPGHARSPSEYPLPGRVPILAAWV